MPTYPKEEKEANGTVDASVGSGYLPLLEFHADRSRTKAAGGAEGRAVPGITERVSERRSPCHRTASFSQVR